jgi:hypothetical protein
MNRFLLHSMGQYSVSLPGGSSRVGLQGMYYDTWYWQ